MLTPLPWQQGYHYPLGAAFVRDAFVQVKVPAFFYDCNGKLAGRLDADLHGITWRGCLPGEIPAEPEMRP